MYIINEPAGYSRTDEAAEQPCVVIVKEADLLARARAGDATAFEALVMPHREKMLRVARRMLRNREDAEDVVQTAFLDALRNLDTFQGRSRFSSWLTRIAVNAALMRMRVSRRHSEVSLDQMVDSNVQPPRVHLAESRPNPEQELSAKEARTLLDDAVQQLGPTYIEVVRMRDVQELSARETAQILGLPVGTVKARLHRGRTKLIRRMQATLIRRQKIAIGKSRRAEAFVQRSIRR